MPFSFKREELSVHEGCILWGPRVVVPQQGHELVLQQLHEGHPRIMRMKLLAGMYVWWSGIDKMVLKNVCVPGMSVKSINPHHLLCQCNRGSGPHGPGPDFIWTM